MKIMHIIDSAGLYGAEAVLLTLCQEQNKAGHYPVIASIRDKTEQILSLEKEACQRGLEAIIFRMNDGPNFIGAWRILRHALSHGFDILHSHGYKGDILFGFIPKAMRKLPLISTLHGWTHAGEFSKMALYKYIDVISLRGMDAVCAVNGKMLDDPRLRKINERKRLHFVPNGIPLQINANRFVNDELTDFCRRGFTVISIGRLSVEKGYKYLIDAFALFCKDYLDAQLIIIGEGPERENLEESVRNKGLNNKVILPGYRQYAWRYLRFCRIFALSSLTEGLPITLLEAMRAGIPVVATDVGGIPQVMGNGQNGLLIPACSPEAMYMALKNIRKYENTARERACLAERSVTMDYSADGMARHYLEIYQSLLSSNTTSA